MLEKHVQTFGQSCYIVAGREPLEGEKEQQASKEGQDAQIEDHASLEPPRRDFWANVLPVGLTLPGPQVVDQKDEDCQDERTDRQAQKVIKLQTKQDGHNRVRGPQSIDLM